MSPEIMPVIITIYAVNHLMVMPSADEQVNFILFYFFQTFKIPIWYFHIWIQHKNI